MKKIVLFSTFLPGKNLNKLLELIFPAEMPSKVLSYMPSDEAVLKKNYLKQWKQFAKNHNTKFNLIDNYKTGSEAKWEIKKILSSNILVITGGNTFTLLRNLRRSGLDKAVKEFVKKDNFILAGFSAGAIVLSPTIRVCNIPGYDENTVDIKDFTGLKIIDFEVFPHYSEKWKSLLEKYERDNDKKVKRIADEDIVETHW